MLKLKLMETEWDTRDAVIESISFLFQEVRYSLKLTDGFYDS